ncbi:Endonuclease MutS2 [Lentibacillus sp. JNUCC-1]|uniref:endonuclease MutS2 n=1 Tax=Lentibacillus sp. JNUCC-1 TaxID=2654513 RepID=UPI0012E80618|nr:endonuclease MutS2 [Lentibacillus sp. JNUCC-1]MUV39379.1 Endonuclease MutS2 [Lentibacillus sp. JNUCC-1]
MNERIQYVLEFNKIIEQLKSHAQTAPGKELCAHTAPLTELDQVRHLHAETDEARHILRLNESIPLGGIVDVRPSLKRSQIGGMLNASECLDISTTLYGGRQAKRFLADLEAEIPLLKDFAEEITPLRELEREINNCIDDHGYMMDSASSQLRGIRSAIRTFESRIRERLESYLKSNSNQLSDAIVTIRNERYVLPVKHEHRSAFGGIVHDQSASGQTLFMEPRSVVDLNNQLQEKKAQEAQEIERILRHLSNEVAVHASELDQNVRTLGEIDAISARAKLGEVMKGALPKLNADGFIKMQQARHPLIPENEVVANDIELGKDYTAIVITGPNTGGKTVTLKMLGLCTLMAQSGLQVPALDGCEMAVFKDVFADIGDEQSIEQNLSTFSSHMTNIVDILERVDHEALVLFDELGAGTDPQEGAALAISILDDVISRGARIVATTHYPELKAYGYNRDQVINASVEFDVASLRPTYRLLLGVPGRSNAFDISKRLGLDESIINHAKSHIGVESKNVENMITSLEKSRNQAEKAYEEAHYVLEESENLKKDIEKAWNEFQQKREQLYQKAEEKAAQALKNAKEEAEAIVEDIRQMKTEAGLKEHKWIEAQKMFESAQPELTERKPAAPSPAAGKAKQIEPGDDIKLLSVNQQGVVLEKIDQETYLVQVGIMKVKVNRSDIQPIKRSKQVEEKPMARVKGSAYHVGIELDLRGERYEEAMIKLEKYIDDALLAGHSQVSIIHGKGTGALRNGVQEFARNHAHISNYRAGKMEEGGSGITILQFG